MFKVDKCNFLGILILLRKVFSWEKGKNKGLCLLILSKKNWCLCVVWEHRQNSDNVAVFSATLVWINLYRTWLKCKQAWTDTHAHLFFTMFQWEGLWVWLWLPTWDDPKFWNQRNLKAFTRNKDRLLIIKTSTKDILCSWTSCLSYGHLGWGTYHSSKTVVAWDQSAHLLIVQLFFSIKFSKWIRKGTLKGLPRTLTLDVIADQRIGRRKGNVYVHLNWS